MVHCELRSLMRALLFAVTIALAAVIAQTEVEHNEILNEGAACAVPVRTAHE